jgi:ZIP family zinc transporter
MTTFFMTTQNVTIGVSVAVAIALHNIPEGIAVALPIYHATGKKRKAIWYAFLSGISEPIGALLALFVVQLFLPEIFIGVLCAAVAGIMIYISFDTLLPLSKEYGDWHITITGIITGVITIWISLLLLNSL